MAILTCLNPTNNETLMRWEPSDDLDMVSVVEGLFAKQSDVFAVYEGGLLKAKVSKETYTEIYHTRYIAIITAKPIPIAKKRGRSKSPRPQVDKVLEAESDLIRYFLGDPPEALTTED